MRHVKINGGWTWPTGRIVLIPAVKYPDDIYFHRLGLSGTHPIHNPLALTQRLGKETDSLL